MATIEEVSRLKQQVLRLQSDADRAAGALQSEMVQLQEQFNCNTIEDAEVVLSDLVTKEARAKDAFDKALLAFNKKWGDVLR